jgi:hypothetical protein
VLYIIDTDTDLVVATFSDDQWLDAQKKLAGLRRARGGHFKLLDH